jgi:hypothetical protein
LKGFPAATTPPRRLSENLDPGRRTSCCSQCIQKYEQELATLLPKELEKSYSEVKSEAARPSLPQWLQNAKAHDSDAKATDQTKVTSARIDSPLKISLIFLSRFFPLPSPLFDFFLFG